MANKLSVVDKDRLLKQKKLILIVDLDQTILHSCTIFVSKMKLINQEEHEKRVNKILKNKKDYLYYKHENYFQYTFFRKNIKEFFEELDKYFEFHVFTMGTREYVKPIIKYLDPTGKLFGSRIKAREDYKLANNKYIELTSIFPIGDDLVCILDDRLDVWMNAINVIQIPPFKCQIVENLNKEFCIKDNQHYTDILNFKEHNILNDFTNILKNIHHEFHDKTFKSTSEITTDNVLNTINVIKKLRNCIFKQNITIYLEKKLLNDDETLIRDLKYKIKLMGGVVEFSENSNFTHILVNDFDVFIKLKSNLISKTIKVVHYDWVNLCFYQWEKLNEDDFLSTDILNHPTYSRKRHFDNSYLSNGTFDENTISKSNCNDDVDNCNTNCDFNILKIGFDSAEINKMADELESFLE